MDISGTDGAEPVTAEELDELLKGLTSFGDIDYRLDSQGNSLVGLVVSKNEL